jgi:hypothetical protein
MDDIFRHGLKALALSKKKKASVAWCSGSVLGYIA